MIIDVHNHYSDGDYYTEYTDYPAQLIRAMDRNGWDKVCVNGLGKRWLNLSNSDTAKAIKQFPSRLIGMGFLEMDSVLPDQVERLRDMGMRGLKILGTLKRYDDDAYLPFYERAQAEAMPILFHTGILSGEALKGAAVPKDISSDRYRPITLDRIARLFPDLNIIAAHMGTELWFNEAVLMMNTHRNVYGDTSGGPWGKPAAYYRNPYHQPLNWNKVVFGSDCLPNDGHIPFNQLKVLMNDLNLSPEIQAGVLGGHAAEMFGIR